MVRGADGSIEGAFQFVHADFATSPDDPKLGDLCADIARFVSAEVSEAAHLDVEYYEDGYVRYGTILDADLDRAHDGQGDPEDGDKTLAEFLAWAESLDGPLDDASAD